MNCDSILNMVIDAFGGTAVFVAVMLALVTALLVAVAIIWRRRKQREEAKVSAFFCRLFLFDFWLKFVFNSNTLVCSTKNPTISQTRPYLCWIVTLRVG